MLQGLFGQTQTWDLSLEKQLPESRGFNQERGVSGEGLLSLSLRRARSMYGFDPAHVFIGCLVKFVIINCSDFIGNIENCPTCAWGTFNLVN